MNKGATKMDFSEEKILETALKVVKSNIAGAKVCKPVLASFAGRKGQKALTIEIRLDSVKLKYRVEIKAAITKSDKMLLAMKNKETGLPVMLMTHYVNPEMAEELRQIGLEFIDSAGNMFINQPPVFVFIKGNKLKEPVRCAIKRAFKKAGLKLIFALLTTPGLENATYREIAVAAGVSLGSIDYIMAELKEMGFLRRRGDNSLYLAQKDDLVKRWVMAYPEQLRPKLTLGTFRGPEKWWLHGRLPSQDTMWSGEVAAHKMTDYLHPETVTIYCRPQKLNGLLLSNRLSRDPVGNIEILEKFWNNDDKSAYGELVHPLLVYADLIASGDPRNAEAAEKIYEQHILQLVREN